MADKQDSTKKRVVKKPETVRERAAKAETNRKPRRINRASKTAIRPFKAVARTARKEVYLPMPDNKAGRFLNKRRRVFPRYFALSWKELRQVMWPGTRETAKLTFAVFLFAIFFGLLISLTDYGLDKVFKKLILK